MSTLKNYVKKEIGGLIFGVKNTFNPFYIRSNPAPEYSKIETGIAYLLIITYCILLISTALKIAELNPQALAGLTSAIMLILGYFFGKNKNK